MRPALQQLRTSVANLPPAKLRRVELLVAAGITLFVAMLHILLLFNRGPLWRDEISSLSLATQPSCDRFWQALSLDPCPPLFFVLLRGWAAIVGDSDAGLRVLGCMIGFACLGALWINARLTNRKTPILSVLLLGASPTLIIWGDSLRAYGVGVCCAILCFALFWRVVAQPTRLNVAGAVAVSIVSVHSLYIDALIVFACASAAATIAAHRRHFRRALLVLAVGAATATSLLPYLALFRKTTEWASLLRVDFPYSKSFEILGFALLAHRRFPFWIWIVLGALAIIMAARGSRGSSPLNQTLSRVDFTRYALLAALIAFGATMVFFRLVGWGTNVWYYLPMLTVAALAIDVILDSERATKTAALARTATALAGISLLTPLLLRASEIRASNLDNVAALIGKHAHPDDLVLVWPMVDGVTFKRYLRRPLPWVTIPKTLNLPAQPGDNIMEPFQEPNSLQPTLERVEATLRNGGRVWLASTWPLELPPGAPYPVMPFEKDRPRSMAYYLRGWGYLLAAQMRAHAKEIHRIEMPETQPISTYEHSRVTVFSGWKEEQKL